jgi:L-amino acid N-acyltransferase YncA
MLIRKLEEKDASELQQCRLLGLQESPEAFLVAYSEVAGTPLPQVASELADQNILYVGAFFGEELVGFMRFVRFQRKARSHVAEVRSVYVKKALRGQGVGAGLLRCLIVDAKAAGIESLVLSVLADNSAARRLYESCGFELYGIEQRAIKKGERYIDQAQYLLNVAAP